ncbi:MAG: hypothetical protein ACXABI_07620 [Candidatus Hodarchaeales archaeon]|jgi:hypothetical protein
MVINSYRVILRKEIPSTDINNVGGILKCQNEVILFSPADSDENKRRSYSFKDLQGLSILQYREWFRKKESVELQFGKGEVKVEVQLIPLDHSAKFLLDEIKNCHEKFKKGTLPGLVGSLIDKIGNEGQKIIKEVGTFIQTSTREISTALTQTSEFIRKATQSANILESFEVDEQSEAKTINLDIKDIDEIMKRSLASENIDAMISSLIAMGLTSAKNQNFQKAMDTLKIAQEAAKQENLEDLEQVVEENIKRIKEAETSESIDSFDPDLSEKAAKYAQDARNIVAEWEKSRVLAQDDE